MHVCVRASVSMRVGMLTALLSCVCMSSLKARKKFKVAYFCAFRINWFVDLSFTYFRYSRSRV